MNGNRLGNFFESLAFLGGGMSSGNIPGAMAQLGALRQNRQQMAADQQMAQQRMAIQQANQVMAQRKLAMLQAEADRAAEQRASALSLAETLPEGPERERAMLAARAAPKDFSGAYLGGTGPFAVPEAVSGMPSGGLLTREELNKEYNLSDYTPESLQATMSAGAAAGGYDPSLLVKRTPTYGLTEETALRKEAAGRIEPIRTAVSQGEQLNKLLDREGPFSDVASVYSLIRFLDPGSVVREGEIGIVSAAQGIWNQVQGMLKQAQGQGFLTDPMRKDMRGMIGELMNLYEKQYTNFSDYYTGLAGQYEGISPERVTGAAVQFPEIATPAAEPPPPTSSIEERRQYYKSRFLPDE